MKRKLTPEQETKRAERKAKLRAMASEIGKMSPEDRARLAATCPVMTIGGRYLSGHNQCMMALQMPGATVVGGFRQWIKAGRAVMKGQHGAAIWVPIGTRATDKETGESETVDKSGFILGTVFDISQTQEIELVPAEVNGRDFYQDSSNITRPKLGAMENQGDLITSTQSEGFALAVDHTQDGAAFTAANDAREEANAATLAQNLELF